MGSTWATPNGGNSAMTGHKNVNNNAAATAKTANYGSGNNTTKTTKAAKTTNTTYASPNEQGQNKAAPVATPSYVVKITPMETISLRHHHQAHHHQAMMEAMVITHHQQRLLHLQQS